MSAIGEKVGYLKGLAEGLKLDPKDGRNQLILGILDLIGDMGEDLQELHDRDDFANEKMADLSMSFLKVLLERAIYDDEDDDEDDDFDEDDEDLDDEDEDDEDDEDEDDLGIDPEELKELYLHTPPIDMRPWIYARSSSVFDEDDDYELTEEEIEDRTKAAFEVSLNVVRRPETVSYKCPHCGVSNLYKSKNLPRELKCKACGESIPRDHETVICPHCKGKVDVNIDMFDLEGYLPCPRCGGNIIH
ncbi:MAG: hypothetical protein IJ708_13850 [Clostridia bacterium]|nr:hypothetical protein [Clostridia bacterium]